MFTLFVPQEGIYNAMYKHVYGDEVNNFYNDIWLLSIIILLLFSVSLVYKCLKDRFALLLVTNSPFYL